MAQGRQTRRYTVKIPMKIRLMDSPTLPEREAESANISSRGVFFATNFPFQIGERVEVLLTMPEEVAGRPSRDWRCHGRVVRTEQSRDICTGVGVEFLYYEILRRAAESVANLSDAPGYVTHY